MAKMGQTVAVRTLAKDIVRMKETQTRFIKLKAELRSLSAAMDSMAATSQMQKAIGSVARTMAMVSAHVSLPELQVIVIQSYFAHFLCFFAFNNLSYLYVCVCFALVSINEIPNRTRKDGDEDGDDIGRHGRRDGARLGRRR